MDSFSDGKRGASDSAPGGMVATVTALVTVGPLKPPPMGKAHGQGGTVRGYPTRRLDCRFLRRSRRFGIRQVSARLGGHLLPSF